MVRAPVHILSGDIFAVLGLHDYYQVTGDDRASELFEAGVAAVRNRVPDCDVGFWSRYSMSKPTLYSYLTGAAPPIGRFTLTCRPFGFKVIDGTSFAHYLTVGKPSVAGLLAH